VHCIVIERGENGEVHVASCSSCACNSSTFYI